MCHQDRYLYTFQHSKTQIQEDYLHIARDQAAPDRLHQMDRPDADLDLLIVPFVICCRKWYTCVSFACQMRVLYVGGIDLQRL